MSFCPDFILEMYWSSEVNLPPDFVLKKGTDRQIITLKLNSNGQHQINEWSNIQNLAEKVKYLSNLRSFAKRFLLVASSIMPSFIDLPNSFQNFAYWPFFSSMSLDSSSSAARLKLMLVRKRNSEIMNCQELTRWKEKKKSSITVAWLKTSNLLTPHEDNVWLGRWNS